MRVLCFDCGTKRIGVSVSDNTQTIAKSLGFIYAIPQSKIIERLSYLLSNSNIRNDELREVVIGNPLNMNGTESESTKKAKGIADIIRDGLKIPVTLWDERLSTRVAESVLIEAGLSRKKRKTIIDAQAAVVILQSYLDYRKHNQ